MKRDFARIVRGMSMDQVEAILGPADATHPTSFGTEKMTTWAYRDDTGQRFVWFDKDGRVKLKSDEEP